MGRIYHQCTALQEMTKEVQMQTEGRQAQEMLNIKDNGLLKTKNTNGELSSF